MKRIFINQYMQLRTGWKIALALTLFGLLATVLILVVSGIRAPGINMFFSIIMAQNTIMILVPVGLWKLLDRKPLNEMGLPGLRKGGMHLCIGLIAGAISMTLVFFLLIGFGEVHAVSGNGLRFVLSIPFVLDILLAVMVGVSEEILFRGYFMSIYKQGGNTILAMIVSSILFALAHGSNNGVSLLALVNILMVGLLFACMYITTGNIWMSVGYHITWNFFQGDVFGFNVSGNAFESILSNSRATDNLINGGTFGPEGGLAATVVILLGFSVIWRIGNISRKATEERIK